MKLNFTELNEDGILMSRPDPEDCPFFTWPGDDGKWRECEEVGSWGDWFRCAGGRGHEGPHRMHP